MGMTVEENFDGSSSRPGSSTGGDDYGDRNKRYKFLSKQNVQALCMRSMGRLFYKLSFKLFLFP